LGEDVKSTKCVNMSSTSYPCTDVNLSGGGYADDGSGYYLTVNPVTPSPLPSVVTVTTPSGMVYGPYQLVTDANGNTGVSTSGVTGYWVNWANTLTDDADVSATITGGAYNSQLPGFTSRAPLLVQYHDTSGNLQTVTVNYEFQYVSYSCPVDSFSPEGFSYSQNIALVSSIVYPDGSSYQFTYGPDGGLLTMQLPTGGTITYAGNLGFGTGCGPGFPANMTRTTQDGSTVYSQTATLIPNGIYPATSTTSITNPDKSREQISFVYAINANGSYGFSNLHAYETSHTWYSAQGSVMRSSMKCYNGASGDCTTASFTLPITQIATTTTVDGLTSRNIEYLNLIGLVTEVDDYGFGASSATRKTVTTYAALGNNIVSKPSSVTVYDASGIPVSKTTYNYDENAIAPMTGIEGHNEVTGARGNLTSQHAWLNTSSATLDSHWTYDDAGQKLSAKDPLQNWTYYTYDSAADTCLTNTKYPTPSSGVLLATSGICDPNTGLVTSSTDFNSTTTSYSYDDMLRPIGTTATNGGTVVASTTNTYSGSSLPETITTTVTATPSPSQVSTKVLDGLGRVSTALAPNGAAVATTYDSRGRVLSVTNPYISGSGSTVYQTTYAYDAFNRTTVTTNPDQTIEYWCYDGVVFNQPSSACHAHVGSQIGTWVDHTDENGNDWQSTNDGLGRLIEVAEPNGVQIAPTMETDYGYDVLNNLLSVTQWGGASGSSGARTRSFIYDSLSRLQSATNPETGTISYTYDGNGNVTTKTSPAVNSTSGTQTIGYCYDALNRMTYKFYSGTFSCANPSGYAASFSYDTSIAGATNVLGRLTDEKANTDGTLTAERVLYQYDSMGRLKGEEQFPYSPNTTAYNFLYNYDLAGNETCANNGIATPSSSNTCTSFPEDSSSIGWQYSYDSAGHLQQAASTILPSVMTNSPSALLQAIGTNPASYDPMGHLVNAQFGFIPSANTAAIQLVRQYDNRGRFISEVDGGNGVVTAPATGSVGSISISGTEAGPFTQPATLSTGTVSVAGFDRYTSSCGGPPPALKTASAMTPALCTKVYDTGTIAVTIGGFTASASYYGNSTPGGLAQILTSAFNNSVASPVSAVETGMNIALTSKSTGLASNYPIYLSYGSDFNLAATGMSGGQDATPPVYDAGTATVIITNNSVTPAVNYTTAAVTWGGSTTSTASTLASNLASAINAAAGSIVTATANNGLISLWSKSTGAGTNYSVSVFIIDSQPTHFPSSSFSASAVNMSGGTATGTGYGTIYSNTVPQGGYAANGNLLAHTDSVMGTWGFGYDTLNRLTSAISGPNAPTSYANNYGCWSYDSFGNRTLEAFSSVTTTPCATGANDNLQYTLTTPTLANQVLGLSYGAAGNVLNDGKNAYLYDPEGRLCAVAYPNGTGGSYYEQYLYDAEGRRVAKGSVGSLTCAAPDAGFTLKNQYLLGQGGEQVTELNGAGTVQHTNAFIGGKLLATYDFVNGGLHFALTDPLGTRRVQVSGTGTPELNCLGLPFGNSLGNARATNCVPAPGSLAVAPDATEHHFTGKERDTESGNDYFGARYYASAWDGL